MDLQKRIFTTIARYCLLTFLVNIQCSSTQSSDLDSISEKGTTYSDLVQSYLAFDADQIALENVSLFTGTGAPVKKHQTILINGSRIQAIAHKDAIAIPPHFLKIDGTGNTVIPGIIGTHNHLRLPRGALFYSAPRLYLACGVTTIQTCGTGHPMEEITLGRAIQAGSLPGPDIINSSPYFTGPDGKENFIRFTDEKLVRDTIRSLAKSGVEWLKVYRHTRPQDLKIIVEEAHKNNLKVSGHLCATTYREAAMLGIDAIEHGFIHSYDHAEGKIDGSCSGSSDFRNQLDVRSLQVQEVQQKLIDQQVALSSTPAIFEAQARGVADPRDSVYLAPFHWQSYLDRRKRMQAKRDDWYFKEAWLKKSLQYDLAFYRAGGLLTAGPDPGLHNLPGFGDQKNYELFIEAGFKPEEALEVMTSNGAKLLAREDIGKLAPGFRADLVLLKGDLEANPQVIREVNLVFKAGKAFDPDKLLAGIEGHVGSESDHSLAYFGLRPPGSVPEILAANFISEPDQYEFGSVFSAKGDEFFYGIDEKGKPSIAYSKLKNGVWTEPEIILSHPIYGFNDPMLTPDGQRLFFISTQPLTTSGEAKDADIWYLEREKKGWSKPIHAGPQINSPGDEFYISFTKTGTLYFSSNWQVEKDSSRNFNIYSAQQKDKQFQEPVKLSSSINSKRYEADVFIAPDESYLIFCSIREDTFGRGDLYISFKQKDGTWTTAKNMGKSVNNEHHQLCPFVTPDGKYFCFTSNQDIYWVDAKILDTYR